MPALGFMKARRKMRYKKFGLTVLLALLTIMSFGQEKMKYNPLTPDEERVIVYKGTERPYSGLFYNQKDAGTYTCKRCDAPLYISHDKFDSGCGWPSFDDEIPGAVRRQLDSDGIRTEILCANCGAHLGHVFTGERFTDKNVRHCVNSISMNFIPAVKTEPEFGKAIFASGCFWGTEYYFQKAPGVISATVGYTGGHKDHPTYKEVCSGTTGHREAVEVLYDPAQTTYGELAKLFFETHDFSQANGQGPDIGEQYLSTIFYLNENQREIAEKLIQILDDKGNDVATELKPATEFWKAEDYHQDYYDNNGKRPYCHFYTKIF